MKNLVETIRSVEEKINILLRQRDTCQNKNEELQTQLNAQQSMIRELKDKLELLDNDNQNLKTVNAMLGSDEYKRETKLKINSLIKEIDQCIVQLSE